MKLHRIRLCNLNSLYGEQELDLDAGLANAPLFLVVGPTGAGKSTLLDAICLALFGSTPRLGKARSVHVSEDDARQVMSHGTGDCWAEVEFSKLENARRTRYLARWRCSRARSRPDGRLQDPHRSLERLEADGSWTILTSDHRRKFYDGPFGDVLEGMTVAEFNRAILLAQGDFAAFLTASVDDRAALLERLTDTEVYKRLGSLANLRRQEVEAALRTTRAVVEGIEFLTDEDREARTAQRAERAATLADAVRLRDRQRELLIWLRSREALVARVAQAEADARRAGEAWADRADDIGRLREHQRCEEAARMLESATVVSADHGAAEAEVETLAKHLAARQAELEEARAEALRRETDRTEAVARREALEPILDAATLARALALDAVREAGEARRELDAAHAAADEAARARDLAQRAREATIAPQALADELEAARVGLAAALDGDADPAAARRRWTAALEDGRARRSALARAAEAIARAAPAAAAAATAEGARDRAIVAFEAAEQAAGAAARELEAASARVEAERALGETLGWTLAVVRGRRALEEDTPCPLCGARDHDPSAAPHEPEVEAQLRASEARAAELRGVVAAATAADRSAGAAAAEARARLQAARDTAASARERADATAAAEREARTAAGLPDDADDTTLQALADRLAREEAVATAALDSLEVARDRLVKAREALAGAEERARTVEEAARTAEARAAAAAATAKASRDRFAARESRRATLQQEEAEAIAAVRRAMTRSAAGGATLDLFSAAARPSDLDLDALEAEADEDLRLHIDAHEQARRRASEQESAVAAATSARDSAGRRLEGLTERLAQRQKLLLDAIHGLGLAHVDALRAARLPAEEAVRLEAERGRLAEAAGRAGTVLAERSTALGEHDERAPTESWEDTTPDDLAEAIGGFEHRIDSLQQEIADLRSAIDLDDEHRRRHRDLLAEERRARARAEVWQKLHRLIGVGDGQAFKNFAQILNLGELIGKANHHLARLSDRYRLTPARDDEGRPVLSFAVIDRYQADEQRPLTTLSGGETFLVSLSLSLALADFRTVRMPIETLLLDEGFGTLDHATLDVAMNALDRLQAGGTQVGIISHVEALKTRIPAQVLVEPVGDGRSMVRVRPPDPAIQLTFTDD